MEEGGERFRTPADREVLEWTAEEPKNRASTLKLQRVYKQEEDHQDKWANLSYDYKKE